MSAYVLTLKITSLCLLYSPPSSEYIETMGKLHPALSLPPPQLEADFRMKVTLNSTVATVMVGDGAKNWTTFTEGVWSGSLGTGVVVVSLTLLPM